MYLRYRASLAHSSPQLSNAMRRKAPNAHSTVVSTSAHRRDTRWRQGVFFCPFFLDCYLHCHLYPTPQMVAILSPQPAAVSLARMRRMCSATTELSPSLSQPHTDS